MIRLSCMRAFWERVGLSSINIIEQLARRAVKLACIMIGLLCKVRSAADVETLITPALTQNSCARCAEPEGLRACHKIEASSVSVMPLLPADKTSMVIPRPLVSSSPPLQVVSACSTLLTRRLEWHETVFPLLPARTWPTRIASFKRSYLHLEVGESEKYLLARGVVFRPQLSHCSYE
jgi:hypothetical protein